MPSSAGIKRFITMRHMHNMAKVMLATGLIVVYVYMIEAFFGWYSGNEYEHFMIWNRMHRPYHYYYFYSLSLHDALPISSIPRRAAPRSAPASPTGARATTTPGKASSSTQALKIGRAHVWTPVT